MYLPRSLTLTATDDIKNMIRGKQTNKTKADISKGEDIYIQSEEVGTGENDSAIEISLHTHTDLRQTCGIFNKVLGTVCSLEKCLHYWVSEYQ